MLGWQINRETYIKKVKEEFGLRGETKSYGWEETEKRKACSVIKVFLNILELCVIKEAS